jgi:DNA-binding transcriptional ArsR family regulator
LEKAASSSSHVVEQVLGNLGRLRILGVLAQRGFPSYTRYGLEKATRLKPAAVRRHLNVLVGLALVKEIDVKPVVYRIDDQEPIINALVRFMRETAYSI